MSKTNNSNAKLVLKLRNIRREKGLSIHDLANKAGIGYQKVGRVERGETQISVEMLHRLAKVLNVPYSQLLEEEGVKKLENDLREKKAKETNVYIIPSIYKEIEKLCKKHSISVGSSVKVHIATTIFKVIQDIHINEKDEEEMVKAFFQGFDAIFERFVVSQMN
ncbi:MAG: helix-turn-helix transcriptional regulator [Gammaproteobacteria bacterium]|jgi:transcriptional regulator with XRE-family HTH domain